MQQKSPGLWYLSLCLVSYHLAILTFIFSVPFVPPSMNVHSSNMKVFAVSKMHYSDSSLCNSEHVFSLPGVKSLPLPFLPESPLPSGLILADNSSRKTPVLPRLNTLYALNKH